MIYQPLSKQQETWQKLKKGLKIYFFVFFSLYQLLFLWISYWCVIWQTVWNKKNEEEYLLVYTKNGHSCFFGHLFKHQRCNLWDRFYHPKHLIVISIAENIKYNIKNNLLFSITSAWRYTATSTCAIAPLVSSKRFRVS